MKKIKILIRADASFSIGTGNVIRCVALATVLSADGHTIHFHSQGLPGNMNDWIQQQGFEVFPLGSPLNDYDLCIIDHYSLLAADEDVLRLKAKKIVAIDDWGERKHNVDLIIDPSISKGSVQRKKINSDRSFESGADWLLLREEFSRLHLVAKVRTDFKNILIFFGGTDPQLQILPYIESVRAMKAKLNHLQFSFLISHYHPQLKEVLAMDLDPNMKVHVSPPSVAALLNESDFYLGSSGTITWERMCLGLPGMTITVVDNQEDIANTLDEKKLQYHLGRTQNVDPKFALEKMLELLQNPEDLRRMSADALKLVDGLGVIRVKARLYEMCSK